ncbi:MAG: PD40 domain-containing protein [Anaerolineales bacterium]|nr:PD40 domain-containing protein [Anaerolineales bacterium]
MKPFKRKIALLGGLILLLVTSVACGGAGGAPMPTAILAIDTPTATATLPPSPLGQIAYGTDRDGDWQVMVMNADGSNEISLTAGYGDYSRPAWSPDGNRLALRMEISMHSGIAVMDINLQDGLPVGSPPTELVQIFADGPRWSPDGTQLAYVASEGNSGWRIYTIPAGGGIPSLVPNVPPGARDVDWSPDGARLVFTAYSDQNQVTDIYVINLDGSGLTQLTHTPNIHEDGPTWSPDGSRIAYSAVSRGDEPLGDRNLYIMNSNGSDPVQVTDDPADEFDPAWSPEGNRLAFTSDRYDFNNGNYEIFVIHTDGSGELRLTHNNFTDRWPTWRAAPAGSSTPICHPEAAFVADVTIPHGTRFARSQDFTKVWRVTNTGTCTWTPTAYSLRFVEGEQMGGPAHLLVDGAIQPGTTFDLAISLNAPTAPGLHMGRWGLFDGNGQPVPGRDGNPLTLTAIIEVVSPGQVLLPAPLYLLSEQSGTRQIWRLETDAATLTQISFENEPVRSYAQSPADGRLAFISQTQVLLTDRNGAGRQVIANLDEEAWPSGLAWSPDGNYLAYANLGIHIYATAAGEDRLLVVDEREGLPGSTAIYNPLAWSPDGTSLLVFISGYESASLAVLSAEDGEILASAPLSSMYAWQAGGPAFYLASAEYAMMVGIDPGLYRVSGLEEVQTVIGDAFVWWPLQRTDGQLAYFASRPAGFEVADWAAYLYTAAPDGSGETLLRSPPLLLDPQSFFNASWVPDGTAVLISIERQTASTSEVLLLPANDDPPLFLMQEGEDFEWEK